jgi:hypothetical protein
MTSILPNSWRFDARVVYRAKADFFRIRGLGKEKEWQAGLT